MGSKERAAIIHKYAVLEHELVIQRAIDQKTLEGERRANIRKVEADHKTAVARLWEDLRTDRMELDAAKLDELGGAQR
jgi:hypothetical protein